MCSIFGTSHPLRPLDYGHNFNARGCCCLLVYCPLVGMEKMVESFFGACSFVRWRTQKRIMREVTYLRCVGSSENRSPPITQSMKSATIVRAGRPGKESVLQRRSPNSTCWQSYNPWHLESLATTPGDGSCRADAGKDVRTFRHLWIKRRTGASVACPVADVEVLCAAHCEHRLSCKHRFVLLKAPRSLLPWRICARKFANIPLPRWMPAAASMGDVLQCSLGSALEVWENVPPLAREGRACS